MISLTAGTLSWKTRNQWIEISALFGYAICGNFEGLPTCLSLPPTVQTLSPFLTCSVLPFVNKLSRVPHRRSAGRAGWRITTFATDKWLIRSGRQQIRRKTYFLMLRIRWCIEFMCLQVVNRLRNQCRVARKYCRSFFYLIFENDQHDCDNNRLNGKHFWCCGYDNVSSFCLPRHRVYSSEVVVNTLQNK